MKKLLKFQFATALTVITTANVVACSDKQSDPESGPKPAPPEKEKTIEYYQAMIKSSQDQIAQIEQSRKEWDSDENKKFICGEITECRDWKINVIVFSAELNLQHANINDYNYQILLLNNDWERVKTELKEQALKLLNDEKNYLEKRKTDLENELIVEDTKELREENQKKLVIVNLEIDKFSK